jgi:hypothetical protein
MKGFLKFLLFLVVVAVAGVGVFYFMISSPAKVVDVEWTQQDFVTYKEKIGNNFDDSHASMEDIFAMNFTTSGVIPIDEMVTNAELTAVANMSTNGNSMAKDIKINCLGNDEIEMSAVIGDISPLIDQFPFLEKYETGLKLIENKEIYMYSTLYYDEATGLFGGETKELYVGKVKVPISQANDTLRPGGSALNDALSNLSGFSVNSFEVTETGFDFDGTIPETLESAGSFDDLAGQLGN